MKLTIAVIVYNRYSNLKRWLNCWQQCEQRGLTLNIIHTGEEKELCRQICSVPNVNYIPRHNVGRDIGAVQDVFRERLEGFPNDWDYLLWITDDVFPMQKDFITPFIEAMQQEAGIAAMQISEAVVTHVRTVAYCITKEVSRNIKFPGDPVINREQGLWFEHRGGNNTLTSQVLKMGKKCIQITPIEISPLWDTGYGKRLERGIEHINIFKPEQKEIMMHHFYHIFADGNWKDAVTEHIKALRMGLIDNLTTFNIGIVGRIRNRKIVKQFLVEQGVFFNIIAESDTGWEQVTQIPMWEFSKTNDGLLLYAHSKGSSNPSNVNIRWRRSMIYWNVLQWRDAVEKLKTHGAYGCHWIQPLIPGMPEHKPGNFMFAGTFFWTHCELMRTWPKPALTHRHEAEGFIGYGWHQSPFKVWDCTPYFPNSNEFADGWINNPEYKSTMEGKSYG